MPSNKRVLAFLLFALSTNAEQVQIDAVGDVVHHGFQFHAVSDFQHFDDFFATGSHHASPVEGRFGSWRWRLASDRTVAAS